MKSQDEACPQQPRDESHEQASLTPPGDRDTAYPRGTGRGTGGRYDEKRDPPFPESAPTYSGHAATDFDASRQGANASSDVPVTDSGVSNANVDEFTTGGNSLGENAGASRDVAPSVSKTVHDSGRRPPDGNA